MNDFELGSAFQPILPDSFIYIVTYKYDVRWNYNPYDDDSDGNYVD